MMYYIKLILTALIVFFILDMFWLGYLAKNMYIDAYSRWLRVDEKGNLQALWWAASIVYLLFVVAILMFVYPLADGSLLKGLAYGALLGLVTYGIYDFTLLAVFKNIPVRMAFIDWAWGTILCAISSAAVVYVGRLSI